LPRQLYEEIRYFVKAVIILKGTIEKFVHRDCKLDISWTFV
jgi:hypothetical protein